ncbi:hypothetical protein [Cronobacter phage JC01]|uniref:Uncharacterized protein n=1 Tax=Cronobacter phage JC01 TaxID=2729575 RepID=A0A6M3YKH3_9CAUD|nr:hypothetical protein JT331_gp75 [Cronobacter phage JC01]QJI52264.1 hypothetical protein [Cronobacter phage JC01]
MSIALILAVCTPLISGGDECTHHYVKMYDTPAQCVAVMDRNQQKLDDRYLACQSADAMWLIDRTNGRSAEQIIADLNASIPYQGGAK